MSMLMIMLMMSIMVIHFKTENVKEISITWGIIYAILFLVAGEWILAPFIGLSAFAVAWSIFSLANYFEESIFLRVMVLVIGMGALIKAPLIIVGVFLRVIDGLF